MDECTSIMWPRKNPDTFRITKLNRMRVSIIEEIDKYAHDIDDLLEYGLKAEADYVKDVIMKDIWKHEAGLYKLICDANPDMKSESEDTEQQQEQQQSTITCPECWWEWDKVDTCPDCGYEFTSDNKKEDA